MKKHQPATGSTGLGGLPEEQGGAVELGMDEASRNEMRFVISEIIIGELVKVGEYAPLMNLLNANLKYLKSIQGFDPANASRYVKQLVSISQIYMYAGDLTSADRIHLHAETTRQSICPESKMASILVQINQGLLLFCSSRYPRALDVFLNVCSMCGKVTEADVPDGIDHHTIASIAANNAAICSLHVGDTLSAIDVIEQTLNVDPSRRMNAEVVRNLSILYSLVFSPATASAKQAALQRSVSRPASEQI